MIPYCFYYFHGQNLRNNQSWFSCRRTILQPHSRHTVQSLWQGSSLPKSPEKKHLCCRAQKEFSTQRLSPWSSYYPEKWRLSDSQEGGGHQVEITQYFQK